MKIINYICSLKPEILFVIIALFFGTISAFAVPQLSVNDEGAHFFRAYSVATGNFMGEKCSYPKEIINKVEASTRENIYSFNTSQKNSKGTAAYSCGTAGGYYPFMHLPQSIGIFISKVVYNSPALMVLFGRIANLLFFAAAMYLIIKYAAVGKWVFFVIGLLPITIHAAASLSYDTFNTVVILGFIAIILNLFGQRGALSRKQVIALTLLALLAAMSKTSNVVLLLLLTILPVRLFKQTPTKYSPTANKLLTIFCIALVSVLSIVIWQNMSGSPLPELPTENRLTHHPLYMLVILYNTYINPFLGYSDVFVRGIVGEFSSFKYHLPTSLVAISLGLITFSLLLKDSFEEKYLRRKEGWLPAMSLVVLVLSFLLITYGLYTMWATLPIRLGPNAFYADGVQGRYFTPLLALLIPIGIWLRKYIYISVGSQKISEGIILLTSLFLLVFYSVQTILFVS